MREVERRLFTLHGDDAIMAVDKQLELGYQTKSIATTLFARDLVKSKASVASSVVNKVEDRDVPVVSVNNGTEIKMTCETNIHPISDTVYDLDNGDGIDQTKLFGKYNIALLIEQKTDFHASEVYKHFWLEGKGYGYYFYFNFFLNFVILK
jgi:hypothetical protein